MKPSIDKGLPIPASKSQCLGRARSHVFHDLEIGDSYFVPANNNKSANTIRQIAHAVAKRNDKTCVSRWISENGVSGVRVWRTT